MCPKCSKLTAIENDVCPYCGNHFERQPLESNILPRHDDSPKPIVPSDSKPSGDSDSIWNELNSLTKWVIIISIPLVILGNPIAGIVGAIARYSFSFIHLFKNKYYEKNKRPVHRRGIYS